MEAMWARGALESEECEVAGESSDVVAGGGPADAWGEKRLT